jgi:hypothetical protein
MAVERSVIFRGEVMLYSPLTKIAAAGQREGASGVE